MKCIGYWKENLKSYLITYDEMDAFSRYRCWVYQREDLNRLRMSLALGPFCSINQDVTSWNYTEGAAVSLIMEEYERERKLGDAKRFFLLVVGGDLHNFFYQGDQCPMNFDDGSNPYKEEGERVITFFKGLGGAPTNGISYLLALFIPFLYLLV